MKQQELKEFISFFIHNKTLNQSQKRKVVSLLARDLSPSITENDINIIDINTENKNLKKGAKVDRHRSGVDVSYISPKNLQKFLWEYNQDDVLKYTCHTIDSDNVIKDICEKCNVHNYSFEKHLFLIHKRFDDLLSHFKKRGIFLDKKMITLISVYLQGEDLNGNNNVTWSSNKIKDNWSSENLAKWASTNPQIIPNPGKNIATKQHNEGYSVPKAFISKITEDRIKTFSELIIFFKSQFHIRRDNSLQAILEVVNKNLSDNVFEISFSQQHFNKGVELFTDIDKLIQAYKSILNICKEHKPESEEFVKLELSLYDDIDSNCTKFCIHHLNTVYRRTMNSAIRLGERHSDLIKNQINGLCDLIIEAEFEDQNYGTLNLWDSSSELRCLPLDKNITGVKYILKF